MSTFDIQIANNGLANVAEMSNPRQVREVVIGTDIALAGSVYVTSIKAASIPNGATVSVNTVGITSGQTQAVSAGALTIQVDTAGPYRLVVTYSGQQRDLLLFGIEAAAITAIVPVSPLRTPMTTEQRQLILRNLSTEAPSWWQGTASSLAGHSLQSFGA
jgi:hypothetical protein